MTNLKKLILFAVCMGIWCPICLMVDVSSRMGEGCCLPFCCGPGALLGLRIKLRVQQNIKVNLTTMVPKKTVQIRILNKNLPVLSVFVECVHPLSSLLPSTKLIRFFFRDLSWMITVLSSVVRCAFSASCHVSSDTPS